MHFLNFHTKKTILSFAFFGMLLAFSACRRECTYVCENPDFGIVHSGFQEQDLDTVTIRRYFANGNFNDLLSVTTAYDVYVNGFGRFEPGSDWEFYIPATQKTYRFSEITREGKTTLKGVCKTTRGCMNGITSYKLNGQLINQSHGEIAK